MDPQVLQIAKMFGIPPELLMTPQGIQMLQLMVQKLGAGAPSPQGQMPAPGAPGLPTGLPGAPPMSPPMGMPGMSAGSPGADTLRRQDPYSMMVG